MSADYSTPDPGDPTAIEADFRELDHAINRLGEDSGSRLEQDETAEAALELLHDLRTARKRLQELEAAVESTAARRMPGKRFEWAGFIAERKGGRKVTTWEHDRVAWAVCQDLTVDESGVVDDAAAELVNLVRDRLMNCGHIDYWRTQQLRALGIDPSRYSVSETARHTVHITPCVAEAEAGAA